MGRTNSNHCIVFTYFLVYLCFGPILPIFANSGCHGSQPVFKYAEGEVYQYDLHGSSVTSVPGAKGDVAKMSLDASVKVLAGPQCTFILKVDKAVINGADGKQFNTPKEVTEYPVKFSTSGSQIFNELLSNEADTKESLNIKKSIISHFQSSVLKESGSSTYHETDFFGTCSTNFNFETEGGVTTVDKSRDLNSCAYREDLNLAFLSTPYYYNSEVQSSPLLLPTYNSQQKFEQGILKESRVTETYIYKPLASPDSGATVRVFSKFILQSHAKGSIPDAGLKSPQSIIFEAPHEATGKTSVDTLISSIQQVVENVEPTVLFDGANKFNQFVGVIKQAKKDDLNKAWTVLKTGGGVKSPQTAKTVFLDALLRAGTGDAISVAVDLLKSNEIPKEEAGDWYLLFGFTKHADKSSLASVAKILDDNAPWKAYFGAGAVANRYFREHSVQNVPEFDALLLKLAEPIKGGCIAKSAEEEDKIVVSLRALGNVKYLTPAVADLVGNCFADPKVKNRIRAAALDTFQTDAGKQSLRTKAIKILQDWDEDAELRIKAYLGLVECVCSETAKIIQEQLEKEPIKQVANFIVTHIKNLKNSVNPSKEASKNLYGAIPIPAYYKNWQHDLRKYSSNHEFSYIFDSLNLGASGEANVIFSPKSFVPRYTSLNVSTHLFGQAFNLFEIDIRAENIEYLLEKQFGPRGAFSRKEAVLNATSKGINLYDQLKTRYQRLADTRKVRSAEEFMDEDAMGANDAFKKRFVRSDIVDEDQMASEETFDETNVRNKRAAHGGHGAGTEAFYKKAAQNGYGDEPELDIYFKLLGYGLAYGHYKGKDEITDDIVDNSLSQFEEKVKTAKPKKFDFKKHFTFLDAELLYPTGLGLTLKLNAVGSSVVNLKFDGKAEVPVGDKKRFDMHFTAYPSAAVEILGVLSVDGYVAESGLKLTSTVHSSSGAEISLKSVETVGVELNVGLPVKKQDIVNFKTEITSVVKQPGLAYVESPITFDVKKAEYGGCFDQLEQYIGLTPCATVSFPFDGQKFLNPIYGPSKGSLRVDKEDDSLKSFLFRAAATTKSPDQTTFELLLDTPGSKTDRKFQIVGEINKSNDKKELKATLNSILKQLSIEGGVVTSDTEKSIHGKFLNDASEYSFKVGATVSSGPSTSGSSHRSFKPFLDYKIPEYSGSNSKLISKKGGKKQSAPVITVEGEIILDELPNDEYPGHHHHHYTYKNLAIGTPSNKYAVNGNVKFGRFYSESDLTFSYDNGKQTVGVKHKGSFKLPVEGEVKADLTAELKSSQYPDFGVAVDYALSSSESRSNDVITRKLSTYGKLTHGSNPQNENSRISFSTKAATTYNKVTHELDHSRDDDFSYPLMNLNGKGSSKILYKPVGGLSVNVDISGKYEKAAFISKLDAKVGTKKTGDYDINFKNKFLSNSLDIDVKRVIVADDKEKFSNTLAYASEGSKSGKYSFNGEITNSKKPDTTNRRIQAQLFVPQEEKPLKFDVGYKHSATELKTHADLTLGDEPYLSSATSLVLSKTNPSGNFKFDLSDLFKSKGSFKQVAGKQYSNEFNLELLPPKIKRTIIGKADLSTDGEKHKGVFELQLDAGVDPNMVVKLETDTSLSVTENKKRFSTDNVFTLLNYVTKFKADAKVDGLIKNGKHSWKFELATPGDNVISGSYVGESNLKEPESDYKFDLEITRGGNPSNPDIQKLPKKMSLKVKVDKIVPATANFNSDVNFKLLSDEPLVEVDANVHYIGSLKNYKYGYKHKAKGSVIPENFATYTEEFSFKDESDYSLVDKISFGLNGIGEGSAESSLKGKKLAISVAGKLDPKYAEKYPANNIREFKYVAEGSFDTNPGKLDSSQKLNWNGDKFINVNFGFQRKEKGGTLKGEVETHSVPKRSFTGSLSGEIPNVDTAGKIDAALGVKWENNEAGLSIKGETYKDKSGGRLAINANHPKTGKVEIAGSNKIYKDKGFNGELSFGRNDKKVKIAAKVDVTPNKPEFDLVLEDQEGGKSRIYLKFEKKEDKKMAGAIKLLWVANGGGSFDADVDADYRSIDDFNYKLNADSSVLKLNKVRLEVFNKPVKGETQKIQYSVKTGGKILVTGSSNYVVKHEDDKLIIEGSGSFKYEDKTYPLTFKYIKKSLHLATDGEVGDVHKFSINCEGMKFKYEGENKITDQTFRIWRNYCSDDKCFVNELLYKFKGSDVLDYKQEFLLQLDLRPVLKAGAQRGSDHPLTLKGSTSRKGLTLNQQLEIQWTPTDKIEYNVYFESTKAGVIVVLPKRTIALESTYDLKKEKGFIGEAKFWLDKSRAPDQKSSILVKYDNSFDKDQRTVAGSGEIRFSHPALPKDLSISGRAEVLKDWTNVIDANLEIDIFQKKTQKIVFDIQVNREKKENGQKVNSKLSLVSKDQNLNYVISGYTSVDGDKIEDHTVISYNDRTNKKRDGILHFEISNLKFAGKVNLFDLVQWKGVEELKINQKDLYLEYTSKHELNGNKFGEHVAIHKKPVVDYVFKWKVHEKPERELGVKAGFNYATKAEVQVTALKDGKKVEIAVATLKFDQENFLKPSESASIDDVKDLVINFKDDYRSFLIDSRNLGEKIGKEFSEEVAHHSIEFTKARPDIKPVLTAFNGQLKELREEIANDKSLKDAAEHIKNTFSEVLETFVTLFETFTKVIETITTVSFDLADKLVQTINTMTPAIVDAYSKISKYAVEIFDNILKTGVSTVNTFLDELKKHEGKFKGLTTFANDLFLGVGKVINKWYSQIQKETSEFYRVLSEQLKSLPIYPLIQERIEELKNLQLPEQGLSILLEVVEGVKDSLPTPELKSFAESLIEYVKNLINSDNKKVNLQSEETKKLFNKFIEAIKSLLTFLPNFEKGAESKDKLKPSFFLPIPTAGLFKYPVKIGFLHTSTFNKFLNGDWKDRITQYASTALRQILKPEDLLPPYTSTGYIVDQKYLFTYNGRWSPLPDGDSQFILAQDLQNNNFSLSVMIKGGKLHCITLKDKEDAVMVMTTKAVFVNGEQSEYPVRGKNLDSWRQYGKILVKGTSGILLECSDDFEICAFTINGFYHNKVKGLLGSLNNEPYLDFSLPTGQHTENVADLQNAYLLEGAKSSVAVKSGDIASECVDSIKDNKNLIGGEIFIKKEAYNEACTDALQKITDVQKRKATACTFAAAYSTSVIAEGGYWVSPSDECEEYADKIEKVSPPYTKADIVFVVEEAKKNEDVFNKLVVPILPSLTEELKKKGYTDVHFSLIGYGSTPWPQHHTKNGEFVFDGKNSKIQFVEDTNENGPNSLAEAKTVELRLRYIYKKLHKYGFSSLRRALYEAIRYPFRVGAGRGIIVVGSSIPKEDALSLLSVTTPLSFAKVAGIDSFYVGPIGKEFLGVDSEKVYTVEGSEVKANDVKESHIKNALALTKQGLDEIQENLNGTSTSEDNSGPNVFTQTFRKTGGAFSSEYFSNANPDQQKVITNFLSKFVAEKVNQGAGSQICVREKYVDTPAVYRCFDTTQISDSIENAKQFLNKYLGEK